MVYNAEKDCPSYEEQISWILTSYGRVIDISLSFNELTQYPLNEVIGKDIEEIWNLLRVDFNLDFKNALTLGAEIFTKNLEFREVEITCNNLNKDERKIYILKEKPNSRLDIKFPGLEQIADKNLMGLAIYSSPNMKLLKANDKYLEPFEEPYSSRKLSIGRNINHIFSDWDEENFKNIWNDAVESTKPLDIRRIQRGRLTGREFYIDSTIAPIFEDGNLRYFIEMTKDITDIVVNAKEAEKQYQIIKEQRDQLERLLNVQEEFFSFISHEFKTPLSVISAAVQAMEVLCKSELGDMGKSLLSKIKRSTLQQIRLVNNLLDITRADAGYLKMQKRNIDMVEVTENIVFSVEAYASQKGVKILFMPQCDEIIMAMDDEKYERIILNLLSNAIKFTPEGKNIYISLYEENERFYIEIKDEGIGIPKEKHKTIFNRYEQASNGFIRNTNGTGIGLCLVKLLVEALGGSICLDSIEGVGTTFRISLPIETVEETENDLIMQNLMENRLVEISNIEFSNIYFD